MVDTSDRFLPYGRQSVDEQDIQAVIAALKSDFLTTGPRVDAFEAALCEATNARHAVACNSGTAALHLATAGLGFGPGDTLVVPAVTFAASANCAAYVGSDVSFADVDPDTGLMTAETLEAALAGLPQSAKPRGVVVVHLNGQSADMPGIAGVARAHNLRIIEDACHAIGADQRVGSGDGAATNAKVGACTLSDAATFSFHPVKTIAAGEAGAMMTNDPDLARRARAFRSHGITRDPEQFINNQEAGLTTGESANPWYYEMQMLGFNYRLSDVLCALGTSQLSRLAQFVAQRRALAAHYDTRLAGHEALVRPVGRVTGGNPAWHLYAVRIDFEGLGTDRSAIMGALRARNVGTQVHYIPVPRLPYWSAKANPGGRDGWPGADRYYGRTLSLPLFVGMTTNDVDRVVDTLLDLLSAR
ncbi:MAG: UDP-4-amino-4,6-dideoxy-N-acetyl-beta-L-altrosamine transaminase [Pseudomonadota bacterium]